MRRFDIPLRIATLLTWLALAGMLPAATPDGPAAAPGHPDPGDALVIEGMAPAITGLPAKPADVPLPTPTQEGGKPLMQALRERQSVRAFRPDPLPMPVLADLLWATAGINRPDSGKRTIPSARNWQIVEVLVVMERGVYRYDAKTNCLRGIANGDLRAVTGRQDFVGLAPVNLLYIADMTRIPAEVPADERTAYAAAEAGFATQNAYLFCASAGLGTVVRAAIDRAAIAAALQLPPDHRVLFAQTVGYPAPATAPNP